QRLQPLHRVAVAAPALGQAENGGARPVPRRGEVTVERVEGEAEVAGEGADERGFLRYAAARQAGEGDEEIGQLAAFGRAAEDVQPIADLHLLQFAEITVELGKRRRDRLARADAAIAVEAGGAD